MPPPVSLHTVTQELELLSDETHTYLNRQSGELVTLGTNEMTILKAELNLADCPPWQRAAIQLAQTVLSSADYVPLPSKFELREHEIMKRFCHSLENEALSQMLLVQIRASGAFSRFKNALHRHDLAGAWYRFRQAALADIAAAWLEAHAIPYTRES